MKVSLVRFNRYWTSVISSIGESPFFLFCIFIYYFFIVFLYIFLHVFFVSVSRVDELSHEDEACIWEVVNYLIYVYPDLVTPDHLHRLGFEPNPGSSHFSSLFFFTSSLV